MARKGRTSKRFQKKEEDRNQGEASAENRRRRRPDGDEPIEIVKVDPENQEDRYGPAGESPIDFEVIDADINAGEVIGEIEHFTDDEDVLQDFSERQRLINEGSDELQEEINQHNSKTPELSAGDIDAAWEDSIVSGEESVGGSVPTPDQDVVDELGEALGFAYEDDEPLRTADKLEERDRDRWELDPASIEEIEDQEDELDEQEENESSGYLERDLDVNMLADEDLDEADLVADNEEEDEEEIEEDLLDDDFDEDGYNEFDLEDDDLDEFFDDIDDEDEE